MRLLSKSFTSSPSIAIAKALSEDGLQLLWSKGAASELEVSMLDSCSDGCSPCLPHFRGPLSRG